MLHTNQAQNEAALKSLGRGKVLSSIVLTSAHVLFYLQPIINTNHTLNNMNPCFDCFQPVKAVNFAIYLVWVNDTKF